MMNILIAGGTGFIGKFLAKFLNESGYKIYITTRNPQKVAKEFAKFQLVKWNPETEDFPADILKEVDAVLNFIGETISQRWTSSAKERIRNSRIISTRKIVFAFSKINFSGKTFINASAIGYYGSSNGRTFVEDSPPGNDFLASLCKDWEAEAIKAKDYGIRTVILRIGVVIGKGGGFTARLLPVFKLGLGGKIGNGKMVMSWIHIEDLARVVKFALEDEKISGVINAVTPNPVTNEEFTRALAKVLKRPAFISVPVFALKILFGKELTGVVLTSSLSVQPKRLIELGFNFKYPDIEGALKTLV